ncbi:MAG: DUF4838 domain-containing protein [Clostridia bacterium]|nr:DUF4838 domain-containing protein [Clostridia bacterium]
MKNATLLIHPDELSYKWIDRMAAHKIPTLALHPAGGRKAPRTLAAMVEQLQDPDYRAMLDYAAEKGLRIEYEMHAARYLLPAAEFEAHPDWFRMNAEGVRSTDWNCCCDSVDALDFIAERAAALVKQFYRSSNRYFLWMDDAKDTFCHCPACQALSPSDQQMKILNHILRRLRQDDPTATLAYLGYFECSEPPEKILPEEGIFLEYAPFERDFHKPMAAQEHPLERLLRVLPVDEAKILEYWYDNSLFSNWTKPPKPFTVDAPVLAADFDFYRSFGFADIGCFACYLGADYEELYGEVDIAPFARAYHGEK